ncbi:MAG: DUF4175 family protein [Chitinophagaceae bacterium]
MNNYDYLIKRLDGFIRKYYTNKLVKGIMLFIAAILAFAVLISLGEYYLYFPSWLRYTFLIAFVLLGGFALIAMIIVPLLQTQKLGKVISHEKAASIIGSHFPDVQDKLLNVLQLKHAAAHVASKELIEASIEQKTKELNPIPFHTAISLAKNKKYFKYLLPPLLVTLFLLFAAPNIFKESAQRLFSPDKQFVPPAPFTFQLLNKKLSIPQYSDIEILVNTKGKTMPDRMYIEYNGQEVVMEKKEGNVFSFTFYKVPKSFSFQFSAAGFKSKSYTINTLNKPVIKQFRVSVDYPDYVGRKDEVLDNIGDIIAPQGTILKWVFNTDYTDRISIAMGHGGFAPMQKSGSQFYYNYRFMRDTAYHILLSNAQIQSKDTLHYTVSVIPDQYPSINVQQYNDSLTEDFVLFVGEAGDDYGIQRVSLNYTIQKTNAEGKITGAARSGIVNVPIAKANAVSFNHFLDINELELAPGDKLSYYFQACDNDAVNGSKCTQSATFHYEKATLKQVDSMVEKTQTQVNKDLNNAAKQSDKIEKEIKQLQEKMLQKSELNWEDKKSMMDMMERNNNLQKQIENIQKKFEQNNKQSQEKQLSENIQEKQENLEKLLDELKNNELNERMKKMEELMKLLNKDKLFEELKQMEQDNKMVEKDLDRMLELMKQLERDMRLEDLAKKAEELAKKQDDLNKQTDQKQKSNDELKKQQDELNKEMEDLKKGMEEMEKVNESMENKMDLNSIKEDQKEAEENMDKSSEELNKNNESKASKAQKSAKNSLQKMADKMNEAASGGGADQMEEDIKSVRQTLQNLIRMSFSQEDLLGDTKRTATSDPAYLTNIQWQQKLKIDAHMIADSLFALSKRQPKMASTVNKEIEKINQNMEAAIQSLETRNTHLASVNQQYVMTGANNLALMLNELLQNLMQQQAQAQAQASGSGSCNKPGKKPGKKGGQGVGLQLSDIISKQQQLGEGMKQMMEKMGKNPGGKKPGDSPGSQGQKGGKSGQNGQGGGGSGSGSEGEQQPGESEQMAKIAAQQSALRKQLNDINNALKKEGKSLPNLQKIQQDMDRNETDIVNKRLTQDILRRQSEIMTRLLESKEALRQQDQGEERESNEGKEQTKEIPQSLKDILKSKQSVIDYYKTVPAELKPYYKKMVEEYYLLIK